ncbi:alcohol dehydrogenase [Rhizoctonia solani]|uniref:Alcohol dehydrogenase n=1 Tax=Rhizoctonia solani TaxID=456999 RepID=A0A8H7H1H8_9AGAM|nr:alcohol dehydrogenase [Rhizoctonia solani]
MTLPRQSTRIFLAERPKGPISDRTFKLETTNLPTPAADQVVVRVDYVSLDPAEREWVDDTRSYFPPVQIGETMRAVAIGTVVQGNDQLKEGDTVHGFLGSLDRICRRSSKGSPKNIAMKQMKLIPPSPQGLLDIGKIKAGETLVVSGAAGATGSLACQIGKIKGARVIGLASTSKCSYLVDQLGVDAALDYTSPTFVKDFCETVGYLDVFFDNVGGEILDLALSRLKPYARVVLSGAISTYNSGGQHHGIKNYTQLIFQKVKMEGFICVDYVDRFAEAEAEITRWMNEGKLTYRYHVEQGLERCPEYFGLLFTGGNRGKL